MKRLSFQILAAKLRRLTKLRSETPRPDRTLYITCFSDTYSSFIFLDLELLDVAKIKSADHMPDVETLYQTLGDLDSITKKLQRTESTLTDASLLFDGGMEKHSYITVSNTNNSKAYMIENPF